MTRLPICLPLVMALGFGCGDGAVGDSSPGDVTHVDGASSDAGEGVGPGGDTSADGLAPDAADMGGDAADPDVAPPDPDTQVDAVADAGDSADTAEPTDTETDADGTDASEPSEDTAEDAWAEPPPDSGIEDTTPDWDADPDGAEPPSDVLGEDVGPDVMSPCEACLASGGTWQPEAEACTSNCDIMDISCYTTSCPPPCSKDSCSSCFSAAECESAGCTWNAMPPAFWCIGS